MFTKILKRERLELNKLLNLERRVDVWNFIKVTLECIQVFEELKYLETKKG